MNRAWSTAFLFIVIGFAVSAAAQDAETPSPPKARLYETLGKSNDEVIWLIMRGFIDELSIDPASEGHIISYGSKRQIDFFQRIVRSRLKTVKFDTSRIKLINGGKKPEPKHQFWIVPIGATVNRVLE